MSGTVLRSGMLDMQVCVPKRWTDEEIVAFAEKMNPAGTQNGWQIRREGNPDLAGDPERMPCERDKDNRHHLTLDA